MINRELLGAVLLSILLTGCGGSGSGNGQGEGGSSTLNASDVWGSDGQGAAADATDITLAQLVGFWDASEIVDGERDTYYLEIEANGLVQDYDWQGDAFDQGEACFATYQNDEHLVLLTDGTSHVRRTALVVQRNHFDRTVPVEINLQGDVLYITVNNGQEIITETMRRLRDASAPSSNICSGDRPISLNRTGPDTHSLEPGRYVLDHVYVQYIDGTEIDQDAGYGLSGLMEIGSSTIHQEIQIASLGVNTEATGTYRKLEDGKLEVTDACTHPLYYQWNSFGQFVTRVPIGVCGSYDYEEVEAWHKDNDLPRSATNATMDNDSSGATVNAPAGGLIGKEYRPF